MIYDELLTRKIINYFKENGEINSEIAMKIFGITRVKFHQVINGLVRTGYKVEQKKAEDNKLKIYSMSDYNIKNFINDFGEIELNYENDEKKEKERIKALRRKKMKEIQIKRSITFNNRMNKKFEPGEIIKVPHYTRGGLERIFMDKIIAIVIKDYGNHVLAEVKKGNTTYKESFNKGDIEYG